MTNEILNASVRQRSVATRPTERKTERNTTDPSELFMYASPFVALSAAGLGVAGLFDRGPSFLRRHPILSALLACGGTLALVKTQFDRFFIERPDYELEGEVNGLELRSYAPRTVAETTIDAASFDEAREIGFKRLAEYIFGDHLAMTSPVTLAWEEKGYVMRFQMPKNRALSSLPHPKDARVVLRRLPSERMAVLRFRGTYAGTTIAEKQRELLTRAKAAGLTTDSEPMFAGYDSPAALPLIRRVEVWVRVS